MAVCWRSPCHRVSAPRPLQAGIIYTDLEPAVQVAVQGVVVHQRTGNELKTVG